jgi:hypothetical protein
MKFTSLLAVILLLLAAGTSAASTFDFRDAATFGAALNQPSFSAGIDGNTITITAMRNGARLWWDHIDGFGVQSRRGYENDEIEGKERLRIGFSTPTSLSSVLITDLFNEDGYLERGFYQLNGSGKWIMFTALPSQTPSNSNGELTLVLDPDVLVSSILFRAPGRLRGNQGREFSVAAIVTDPPIATPIPAAFWLLGSGLMGLVALRRRMRE